MKWCENVVDNLRYGRNARERNVLRFTLDRLPMKRIWNLAQSNHLLESYKANEEASRVSVALLFRTSISRDSRLYTNVWRRWR